jgi:hypothetical protein
MLQQMTVTRKIPLEKTCMASGKMQPTRDWVLFILENVLLLLSEILDF